MDGCTLGSGTDGQSLSHIGKEGICLHFPPRSSPFLKLRNFSHKKSFNQYQTEPQHTGRTRVEGWEILGFVSCTIDRVSCMRSPDKNRIYRHSFGFRTRQHFSSKSERLFHSTGPGKKAAFREITSCSCLTFLPGPACVLLSKIYKPFPGSLYMS